MSSEEHLVRGRALPLAASCTEADRAASVHKRCVVRGLLHRRLTPEGFHPNVAELLKASDVLPAHRSSGRSNTQ